MFRPVFTAAVPAGWQIRSGLDYSDPTGNIRVSVFEEPVPPEFTTEHYAEAYGHLLRDHFPGYRELTRSDNATSLGGLSCVVRRLRWQPAQGPPLVQTQAYLVLGQRGVVATASGPEAEFAQRHDEVDAALDHATIGPMHLTPRSPAAVATTTDTPSRFDAGKLLLEPSAEPSGDEADLICTIDELAAFARGLGLAAFPGAPDALDGLTDGDAEQRFTAARRSLRARGLVEIHDGTAHVGAPARPMSWLIDAEFMLTLESSNAEGTAKRVWYGSAGHYMHVVALDEALVRIGWTAKDTILAVIDDEVRAEITPPRLGRVAWLGKIGHRYEGAAIEWQRGEDGAIVEIGADSPSHPIAAPAFVSGLADAIRWPT